MTLMSGCIVGVAVLAITLARWILYTLETGYWSRAPAKAPQEKRIQG